jgi:hypothetical protein
VSRARSFRQPKAQRFEAFPHQQEAADAARLCGAEVNALRHRPSALSGSVGYARLEVLEPEGCPLPKDVRKQLKRANFDEHPAPAGYVRRWVHG